jgi:hypothetical protein
VERSDDLADWPQQRPDAAPADLARRRVWMRWLGWTSVGFRPLSLGVNLAADGPPNWWACATSVAVGSQGIALVVNARPRASS